jgi:ethanolamine transporter
MGINEIIIWIMTIIMVIGAIDRVLGNKTGLGEQFEEGILAMGSLALSMVGIIVLAPKLSDWLSPIVVPLYRLLGADPAMFAGTLLANDMGGFFLAQQMTTDPLIVLFSGGILGAMLGATLVFTIPVGLGIIRKEDTKFLAQGVLCGIITIPIGAFVGGIAMGMPIVKVIMNLIPIIAIAILISVGLFTIPEGMIKGFNIFGKIIIGIASIGLAIGALDLLVGIKVFENQDTLEVGFQTVGGIAVTLAGAYGLVFLITKLFRKPLMRLGKLLGMNDVAAAGLIASLANNIAMFQTVKDMDNRGKVINIAFAVSASFTFGDHLGFTAGVAPELITPMIIGKLVGGIAAVIVAIFLSKRVFRIE